MGFRATNAKESDQLANSFCCWYGFDKFPLKYGEGHCTSKANKKYE